MAASKAPQFSDGNVEIHFSTTDEKYILHSHILALHSSWFKACLSERWNSGNGTIDRRNHWVFELRFEKKSEMGMLKRKGADDTNPDTEFISGAAKEVSRGATKHERTAAMIHNKRLLVIRAHRDMLAALYHVVPSFTKDQFYGQIELLRLLAQAAEMYDCQTLVKLPMENYLHGNRNMVLGACCSCPMMMLELALPLKSKFVFIEASVVLICSSRATYDSYQDPLAKLGIQDLIQRMIGLFGPSPRDRHESADNGDRLLPKSNSGQVHGYQLFRQSVTNRLVLLHQGSSLGSTYAMMYQDIAKSHLRKKKTGKDSRDLERLLMICCSVGDITCQPSFILDIC